MKKIFFLLVIVSLLLLGCNQNKNDVSISDISFNSAYADIGYSDEGFSALYEENLNSNIKNYSISSYIPPRLIKISSSQELESFKEKYKSYFSFDGGYDDIPSFNEACKKYNEDFFKKRTLYICYIIDGSGSVRHSAESVRYADKTLTFNIKAQMPEIGTCDMCGRVMLFDVLTRDTDSTKEYNVLIK